MVKAQKGQLKEFCRERLYFAEKETFLSVSCLQIGIGARIAQM